MAGHDSNEALVLSPYTLFYHLYHHPAFFRERSKLANGNAWNHNGDCWPHATKPTQGRGM